ncbi:uncharacterized protein FMAN_14217 [Fusarium mangiferae]|uniref:C2H2-type domain-containing protein n=1 Tax=Fusarium mangiferae TaxID=192010 RepID=A0A1L7UCH4_FUSMA|nr:uncharacterized protein FMAN_14217 [Fusarium mangiferae]CVL08119.1 uncharacterized protein FMAN_14217 [Fusarium mangiferae]
MSFACCGCTRVFGSKKALDVHEKNFAGVITTAFQRFSSSLANSPHDLLKALLPSLHHLLQALESDSTEPREPSPLRTSLSNLLQALEHTPIPCPDPRCGRRFDSEKNLKRHYEKRELNTEQRVLDDSNLMRRHLKRTREECEEGKGADDERGCSNGSCVDRGVGKGKRGESEVSNEESEDSTLTPSDNLRPEQMSSSKDQTARQNTVRQEGQCSSAYENIPAAQQEPFSYVQNSLFDSGPSGGGSGGPTILISRNEATMSFNINGISHPYPWSNTEVTATAQAPSTTYGNHAEGLEPQSNGWVPGAVQAPEPAPTNYLLVENDVRYAQAPALDNHPVDQPVALDNMFGTQHNDKMASGHPLQLDYLDYGAQRHPP